MEIIKRHLALYGKSEDFIDCKLPEEFGASLTGIKDGVELIKKHMAKNSKIIIYADFDCDGSTGAVVLDLMFKSMDYDNHYVLMNERIYGNGFNQNTLDTILINRPVDLVITTDHGSSDDKTIQYLREQGIDVLVTDHHHMKDDKPLQYANVFINPQQEKENTYKSISGCATSYALAIQVLKGHVNEYLYRDEMLELVAISTIGDMMDMSNEVNRAITKIGIEKLNSSKLGKAYRRVMNYPNAIDSKDISFSIVPMINSCSRVASASIAYISLIPPNTESRILKMVSNLNNINTVSEGKIATSTAVRDNELFDISLIMNNIEGLKQLNTTRKARQSELMQSAVKQINENDVVNIIVIKEGTGINGILASQIGNETKKPTVVFIHGTEKCSGSGRAIIPGFSIKKCFDWIKEIDDSVLYKDNGVAKYGGHDGAAGIAVNTNSLVRFKELMTKYIIDNNYIYKEDLTDIINKSIDITNMHNLVDEIQSIKQLEPFGNYYASPMLMVRFDLIKDYKQIPINPKTKLIKFTGVIGDLKIGCSMFTSRERDIEVRDKDILGTVSFTKELSFDIKHIID